MQVTKFEHACLDIQQGDTRLVIDPGVFSTSFNNFSEIDVMVITHVHSDHFDPEKVAAIIKQNPMVQIFTTQEVATQLPAANVQTPSAGQSYTIKDIELEFFGGEHAVISPKMTVTQNIGVLVNNLLYYPGDSLVACPKPHQAVAVPTMAPWLKFSEAEAFLQTSLANQVFPTHNGFINANGQALYDRLLGATCQALGKQYAFVEPDKTIEL